jgi:hypothetical protein
MNNAGRRLLKAAVIASAALMAATAVQAQNTSRTGAGALAKQQYWTTLGGTVGMRWNRELAADLGLSISAAQGRQPQLSWSEQELFHMSAASTIDFDVRNGNVHGFLGGMLQARGGYTLDARGLQISLQDFRLVPRKGEPFILDLVSADGKAWFYTDRLMYELIDDHRRLAVRTMDLRISPELARRLGNPDVADWVIADMEMTADVARQGSLPEQTVASNKWHGYPVPGVSGATFQADLFMQTFSAQYSRCDGCTGVGGNGRVVLTPSSTLRNNVNHGSVGVTVAGDPMGSSSALYAADIPWYSKFTGNFAPYSNDQHPYLIWNLYRFNTDGSMEQIGRSGVKHAFLTTNTNCIENPGDGHILGRGCYDVYSVSNNDSNSALGPRSEIIPATNQWGRCGSIYDTNCDGNPDNAGNGNYDQRLIVRESQFSGAEHQGATYLFDSWYLARHDVNILNSMATKRVTFTRSGTVWNVGANDQYRLGPAIDRWIDPANPGADATSVDLPTSEGRVKVAGKAIDLGGGRWRYHYAVQNLDFARAVTQGAEPNLRVISNLGLNRFTVSVDTASISDIVFGDGDLNANNDWTASVANRTVTWSAPAGNELNWGTLFRFSFIANLAPSKGTFSLNIATAGTPSVLKQTGLIVPTVQSRIVRGLP